MKKVTLYRADGTPYRSFHAANYDELLKKLESINKLAYNKYDRIVISK